MQCLNHINLASGINMDGLQLLFPPPLNRLKIDQCKGPRGPLPPCAYSVKSFSRRGFTGSNVRRRCQNKIANKASKLNELPGNSCSRGSLVSSPSLFPHGSAAVNSSDKFTSNTKEDKSLKKSSRKRMRKKVRQSKKQPSNSGSTERVHTEEYVCVSLSSETCSSNDAGKEVGLMHTTAPDFSSSDDRLTKIDCKRNEMNENTYVKEAPKSCDSCIDEEVMSKATAPVIQNSSGECATFESKYQLQDRNPDFTVIDRETKDTQHVELCCFNDIQDSLVLDSVSIGSKSDESTNGGDIGRQSNKGSCGITSNSGDGYFLDQNLVNGIRNNCEHNEGMRHGGQNCIGSDKRVKQKRTMSKSSSFNKFGGASILHGRTGKENSHSVWQKVQKNSSDECGGDVKKATEKDPSAIKNCNSANVNAVSKPEDKKHLKNKVGRKSKGKMESVPKKGHCSYSRKGSHFNKTVLNDNVKGSIQQSDSSNTASQEINQGLSSVSDINCLMAEFQRNGVEQEASEIIHSAQFHPQESDIQKSACHGIANTKNENIDIQDSSLVVPGENTNQSNMSDEQSHVSFNLLDDEVGQTVKEVSSADYNAQNQSSGSSTLWKWIPIGKKDAGLAKSESSNSSSEYSDELPSKNFNLENSLEPKVASFSQNQDPSPIASTTCMDQIYNKASCLDEGENHKLGSEIACTLTENRDKLEVANHMIYECENQDMLENDSYRIAQAVSDACRAQLACKAVHMATGGPVAEFERLLHFCSPVICQSPNSLSCLTCSEDHSGGISLCRHEMPALSLGCLWQWYEKHGSYGLEIRAQDYENPKRLGHVGHFPFRAYFVPSLSAVQLFKNRENRRVNNSEEFPNCKASEACEMVDISEESSPACQHSISSVLCPQPRNQDASIQIPKKTASINNASDPSTDSNCPDDLELLFEYFECEQPQQRWPLYEK